MPQPKLIYLAQRRRDLNPAAFTARWRQHAALGMSQPRWRNVERYLHCDTIRGLSHGLPEIDSDGVAIVVFHDEASRQNHIAEEASRVVMKTDERETFAQPVAHTTLLTHEHIIKPGPVGDYKLFVFWEANDEGQDFLPAWRASGQHWLTRLCDLNDIGVVQNRPVQARPERLAGLHCDGIDEISSPDPTGLQLLAQEWVHSVHLPARAQMVLTRAVVLHDKPRVSQDRL